MLEADPGPEQAVGRGGEVGADVAEVAAERGDEAVLPRPSSEGRGSRRSRMRLALSYLLSKVDFVAAPVVARSREVAMEGRWREDLPDPIVVPLGEVRDVISALELQLERLAASDDLQGAEELDVVIGRMTRWIWDVLGELDEEQD